MAKTTYKGNRAFISDGVRVRPTNPNNLIVYLVYKPIEGDPKGELVYTLYMKVDESPFEDKVFYNFINSTHYNIYTREANETERLLYEK